VFREIRERLNLTQGEMAERIGVKQPAISKIENGDRHLTLETLSEIIAVLGEEWELNVKLSGNEVMWLTGSEDFAVAQSNDCLVASPPLGYPNFVSRENIFLHYQFC
jgi:transcriptional regulator with XRE-family HTH domain